MDEQKILERRSWLATVKGVRLHTADGADVDEAPYSMMLGNAILHVASLETAGCEESDASVMLEGIVLDCAACRALARKFGEQLAVRE